MYAMSPRSDFLTLCYALHNKVVVVVFGRPLVTEDDISFDRTTTMRGKKISTDLNRTILALGDSHSVSEIEAFTAVSCRQIYRIRNRWATTGCVEPEHIGKRGRPCFLTKDEEAVSFPIIFQHSIVETSPSISLHVFEKDLMSILKTSNHK